MPIAAAVAQVRVESADNYPAKFSFDIVTVRPLLFPVVLSLATPQLVTDFPEGGDIEGLYAVVGTAGRRSGYHSANAGQVIHLITAQSVILRIDGGNEILVELTWSPSTRNGSPITFPVRDLGVSAIEPEHADIMLAVRATAHIPANLQPGVYSSDFELIVEVE